MSLATDYGAIHRQALIRSARVATLRTVALADRRCAERELRAQEMAVHGFGDLLATLASRDPDAHDHLQVLMLGVIVRRQPMQALQAAATRYALAALRSPAPGKRPRNHQPNRRRVTFWPRRIDCQRHG